MRDELPLSSYIVGCGGEGWGSSGGVGKSGAIVWGVVGQGGTSSPSSAI